MKADHPAVNEDYALYVAPKDLNDTMGVDGLTPTLFVYGVHHMLMLPNSASTSMPQLERLRAQKLTRDEYARVEDEQRLKAVQKAKCPSVLTDLM